MVVEHYSIYTGEEIDRGVGIALNQDRAVYYAVKLSLIVGNEHTTEEVDNAEWQEVIVDGENKILAGVKTDGSYYVAELK